MTSPVSLFKLVCDGQSYGFSVAGALEAGHAQLFRWQGTHLVAEGGVFGGYFLASHTFSGAVVAAQQPPRETIWRSGEPLALNGRAVARAGDGQLYAGGGCRAGKMVELAFQAVALPAAKDVPELAALRVLTYNVNCMPIVAGAEPMRERRQRAQRISALPWLRGYDILVLQELMDYQCSYLVSDGLMADFPFQTPCVGRGRAGWDSTSGVWGGAGDGGVMIFSKWPITHKEQFIYRDACWADWHANKGFAYVRVLHPRGVTVHVLGTHMQAWPGRARFPRRAQIAEMGAFIAKLATKSTELLLVAGDLNTDRLDKSNDTQDMLHVLHASQPQYACVPPICATMEPASNEMLQRNGCPSDAPNEWLDYVLLHRSAHAGLDLTRWRNVAFRPEGKCISDHYPVAGGLDLAAPPGCAAGATATAAAATEGKERTAGSKHEDEVRADDFLKSYQT
eukprot:g63854.t1